MNSSYASFQPSTKTKKLNHLKSTLTDLRNLCEHSFTTKYIAEKLRCCIGNDDATAIREVMEISDYDVFGIEEKGAVYGYVDRSQLKAGTCGEAKCTFQPWELVAESTTLFELLPILRDTPRVFVLERNRIGGIVTRGDLQKAPMRMLLFELVTLLEMHLLRLVRIHYPEDSFQKSLSKSRLKAAQKLLDERQRRNEAIDLADCLQFCDKRDLILKKPDLREALGMTSKKEGEKLLEAAESLRNKLAHGQDIVAGSSWPEIIDLVTIISEFIEKCERIVR